MKERKHIDENYSINSISKNGVVTFNNIPSGHKYKLHEIETDIYHDVDTTMYNVTVSYGVVVTDLKDNKVINKYKTRNLTILKEVLDVSSNKSFEFEIEATYRGKNLDGTYKILKNGIEGIIKFENGKATFLLKHNEKIEIKDLPYDIKYKIKEINSEGFVVKYQVNDGEIKLFDINNINENILGEDTNIKFINSSGYEMPATGSSGMLILIIMGSLLSAIPVIYISISVLKKKADY